MKAIIYLLIGALFVGSLAYAFDTRVAVGTSYFNGSVGIGTDSPQADLDVRGDVNITGTLGLGITYLYCDDQDPGCDERMDLGIFVQDSCPADHLVTGCMPVCQDDANDLQNCKAAIQGGGTRCIVTCVDGAGSDCTTLAMQIACLKIKDIQ